MSKNSSLGLEDQLQYSVTDDKAFSNSSFVISSINKGKKHSPSKLERISSLEFISEAGGASAAGAALFWANVIFSSASATGRLIAGIAAGITFFIATGILVGWSFHRKLKNHLDGKETKEGSWSFWLSYIFNTIGFLGLVIGANYFFWKDYIDFKDLSHLTKPINIKDGILIGFTAFISIIFLILVAVYLIYMKYYIRNKKESSDTEKEKIKSASTSKIEEKSDSTKSSTISQQEDVLSYQLFLSNKRALKDIGLKLEEKEEVEQNWVAVLNQWDSYINAHENLENAKTIQDKQYGIKKSRLGICAIIMGAFNTFFGAVNSLSFADFAFGDLRKGWSIFAQVSFIFISASLSAIFFTKDFASVSEDFHYKKQENEKSLVLKEGRGFENLILILNYMLEYKNNENTGKKKPLVEAINTLLNTSNNGHDEENIDNILFNALQNEERLKTQFWQGRKTVNSYLNILIILGLILQFIGAYYMVGALDYFKEISKGKAILFGVSLLLIFCIIYDFYKNKRKTDTRIAQFAFLGLIVGGCSTAFIFDYLKGVNIEKTLLLGGALFLLSCIVLDAIRLQIKDIKLGSQNKFRDLKKDYNELKKNITTTLFANNPNIVALGDTNNTPETKPLPKNTENDISEQMSK